MNVKAKTADIRHILVMNATTAVHAAKDRYQSEFYDRLR